MGRILFRKVCARSPRLRALCLRTEGTVLYLFWKLVQHIPPEHACATGGWLIGLLGPRTHKHARIRSNLRLAFPERSGTEIDALTKSIWRNFGAVLAELPHFGRMTVNGPSPSVHVELDPAARPVVESRQPAIYVSAHLGNWEAVAFTIAKLGIPLTVVYGPQRNPALDALLHAQRQVLGCRLVAKENAIRELVGAVRGGRSVGLLADQRVDTGAAVPFFGVNAPTTTSPAWLALKLRCPLVPVQIERLGNARFRAIFHRPIAADSAASDDENILQITTDLNRLFETWIRDRPEQWLCIKRRWPAAEYGSSMSTNRA